ncbi:hypothetical protein [Fusibacter sp. 3D3]|uniref:hypothetical protein n=1 Tax=Fusibacter sp. 3D3 TaxID=1048380 RepID=UPI000853BB6B|nr:hypothetical protein [Fusibacter sp. 3D3]GAU76353.1 hypothetical protein F3D3_0950 [Fusibacter sp. 3D3]
MKEKKSKSNKAMNLDKPHPIFAGVMDFYFFSIIVTGLLATISSFTHKSIMGPKLAQSVLLLDLIVVVLYHVVLSKKISVLSLGEKLAGKVKDTTGKTWSNPYQSNRIGIYIVMILAIFLLGNDWNQSAMGHVVPFAVIVGKWIRFGIILKCLLMISERKLTGLKVLILMELLGMVGVALSGVGSMFTSLAFVSALVSVVVFIKYNKAPKNTSIDAAELFVSKQG